MAIKQIELNEVQQDAVVPVRGPLLGLFVSLRPRQWTKNLVVFAGLLFSLDLNHHSSDFLKSLMAFFVFCLVASATYLINDVADVASDRMHPTKRFRPIAAGQLSPLSAIVSAILFFVAGITCAYLIRPLFAGAVLAYVVTTVSYSIWLKHIVIVDLLTLATGFVLRAVAGAWAIQVPISEWLLLCTLLLALFLGIGKRRAELIAVLAGRKKGRGVISEYTSSLLDQMGTVVASSLVMSYALYSIQSTTAAHHHYLVLGFPFVLYGILRYSYLVHKREDGEAPDEILLRDKSLLCSIAVWGILTAFIMTHRL